MNYSINIFPSLVILGLIFAIIVFSPNSPFNTNDVLIKQHKHIVDSLKKEIDLKAQHQLILDEKISNLNDSIIELQYVVRKKEHTISTIKKETNEILNIVSKFNSSDILQWSTDRYKDSLNIK